MIETPEGDVAVPASVLAVAGGRPLRPVWRNEAGGPTFEVGHGSRSCFVKWTPADSGIDLPAEAKRLEWAAAHRPAPRVLGLAADPLGSWMVTAPLPGENAVTSRWWARPDRAVPAIGRGLRAFHDALPVAACPYSWSAADRLADVRRRAARDLLRPKAWHAEHRSLSVADVLECARRGPAGRPIGRMPGRCVRAEHHADRTVAVRDTSTWAASGRPIGGPTSPSPPGAPPGTTAQLGGMPARGLRRRARPGVHRL